MRLIPLGTVIFCVLSYSCYAYSFSQDEMKEVVGTLQKYNTALMKAYRSGDFGLLKEVATERQFRKVMVYIQSYTSAGEKILSELKSFEVKEAVKKRNNKVEVITLEEWTYSRIEHRTGKTIVPRTLYTYKVRYIIVKDKDNKWKVSALKVLDEKKRILE